MHFSASLKRKSTTLIKPPTPYKYARKLRNPCRIKSTTGHACSLYAPIAGLVNREASQVQKLKGGLLTIADVYSFICLLISRDEVGMAEE